MPLNKVTLKEDLQAGFTTILSSPQLSSNVPAIADQLATLISNKIDLYVKQGAVTGVTSDGATIVQSQII